MDTHEQDTSHHDAPAYSVDVISLHLSDRHGRNTAGVCFRKQEERKITEGQEEQRGKKQMQSPDDFGCL